MELAEHYRVQLCACDCTEFNPWLGFWRGVENFLTKSGWASKNTQVFMFADLFVARSQWTSLFRRETWSVILKLCHCQCQCWAVGQPHRKHTDPAVSCVALLDVVKWPEVVIVNVDSLKVHCPWWALLLCFFYASPSRSTPTSKHKIDSHSRYSNTGEGPWPCNFSNLDSDSNATQN